MNKRELYRIFKTAIVDWIDDNSTLRAAALTFFIILPLPTLLLIVNAIFAQFLGEAQAIQILVQQITSVVGPAVAELFSQLILNTGSPFTSSWTAVVIIAFSIGGAIGAFSVLRDTMDCIWEVRLSKGRSLGTRMRQKIVPFALVSALGLIVIAWTSFAGGLFTAIRLLSINEILTYIALTVTQVVLSFALATLLLAIIYKMIPEAKVHWRDVALAALVTGIAFTVTNYIFGAFIQTFTITTVAGAAGSLLIILLWIFVLNEIVLFGAEVSKVYATTVGAHSKRYLPESVEKIMGSLQKVGEKIEDAVKEDVVKIEQPNLLQKEEQIEVEISAPKKEETTLLKPASGEIKPQTPQDGSVEIDIKIKPPKKRRKSIS